jgi:hypothetical protein
MLDFSLPLAAGHVEGKSGVIKTIRRALSPPFDLCPDFLYLNKSITI